MLTGGTGSTAQHSSWYAADISTFLVTSTEEILGQLARTSEFADEVSQKAAWLAEIRLLRSALADLEGWLYLEFDIPRLSARIDAVVVSGSVVVPIEFKVGESRFQRIDIEQAWDYGLDLKNFHEASHDADILPLLVATEAASPDRDWPPPHMDGVRPPRRCNAENLAEVLRSAVELSNHPPISGEAWGRAPYRPTPTIIQAARALYNRHTVEAITRSDAGATNLRVTSAGVEDLIEQARTRGEKIIVFVTGVPGAGKTLVGLNIATRRSNTDDATHAVYLSGNGPLVAVLHESLTRDEMARRKAKGEKPLKKNVGRPIKAFIQNVHHFRDEGLRSEVDEPDDHVVIFDESQRAWSLEQTRNFMARRKGRPDFNLSEPEFLLQYMDRHGDWAVVICLVGGGQEINTGEAGISSWLEAVRTSFPKWQVYISPDLKDDEYSAKSAIARLESEQRVHPTDTLHLHTSLRSFRAENVSRFVKAVLDCDTDGARSLLQEFQLRYQIALTRDLAKAREWVRNQSRGSEQHGLVASSQAMRLKPHAIDVRVNVDPVHYFLADRSDPRSSYYLEDAATEFQIQGLELDWVVMNWDADLRRTEQGWSHHSFIGSRWTNVNKPDRRQFLVNAYRVLLTRARQGMVIFVPEGDRSDPTRRPEYYDPAFQYLREVGIEVI